MYGEHLSHLIFADDIFLVANVPVELESMLTDIHLASKPVGISINLSKIKVMLNENAITSTVAVDGIIIENAITPTVAVDGIIIENVDRYVYLCKRATQAGGLLPGIMRRIALGWAAFSNVANIMNSRKASMNTNRKVRNECVLLKKAHVELLSVAKRKLERIMLGIALRDHKRNTWIRHQTGVHYIIDVIKN